MSIESSRLRFSGHQTFPIRYGWIYKIIQELKSDHSISSKGNIEAQMISMGMGKNMVLSIRHWIKVLRLVECTDKEKQHYQLTPLAESLFSGNNAYDEFLDKIGTIWLLHWLAQSVDSHGTELNTARWFFNYFNGFRLDKAQLVHEIQQALASHNKAVAEATLRKDIDCFLQMYAAKSTDATKINEDSFTSPLTELGLLAQEPAKTYRAELSTQESLPVEIFAYAAIDYMRRKRLGPNNEVINNSNTLSFDCLLSDIGSPGRVFRLTARGLSEKLDSLELLTQGKIAWTDTQGLRQVQYSYNDLQRADPSMYFKHYYCGE